MSKLHFSKVSCPYCLLPSDGDVAGKVFIKAEYWRRHVTEVHNKAEEIEETKKLVLCLECYNCTLSKRVKPADGSAVQLPEFDGLFRNETEQKNHVAGFHNGNEVEFISVWDKKEAAGSSRTPRTPTPSTPPVVKQEPEKVVPVQPPRHPQYAPNQPIPSSYSNHYNSYNNGYQTYHPYYNNASYQPTQQQQPPTLPRDVNQVQTLTCQISNPQIPTSAAHLEPMAGNLYDNFHYNQPHYQVPQHEENSKYNIVFANDF